MCSDGPRAGYKIGDDDKLHVFGNAAVVRLMTVVRWGDPKMDEQMMKSFTKLSKTFSEKSQAVPEYIFYRMGMAISEK